LVVKACAFVTLSAITAHWTQHRHHRYAWVMLHKTRESSTTNNPPMAQDPIATDPAVEAKPVRLVDQAALLAGDPRLLTADQEKALADYAVRAGMTIEQARVELLALPRAPAKQ